MKKLCLVFSACAALAFSSTVNAQVKGDIIQSPNGDYKAYEVLSDNLFVNGSFETAPDASGNIEGWYGGDWKPANTSNFTYNENGGFDGGAFLTYSASGASDPHTLRNYVAVDKGGTYMFVCYVGGKPNLEYSFLYGSKDGKVENKKLYTLKVNNTWTKNVCFCTSEYQYIGFRSSWVNNCSLDGVFLGKVKEIPNTSLLDKTIIEVNDLYMGADQYEAELGQRLKNWAEYAGGKIDRTDCDAVSGAIATIKNITKDLASYNEKVIGVKEEIARASELGVDAEVWNAYLSDPFYDIDGLCHDLIVEEFNVVKNLYAEEEDTKLDFRPLETSNTSNTWLNEKWLNENLSGNDASPIGYKASKDYWNGDAGISFYNLWSNKYEEAYTKLSRTITLPAGEYVLKVSGRSLKADVVASIDGKQVSFPKLGSLTGYGIDINGDANYSADGVYANSDKGYAWEWRLIPLTLDSEKEVEIFVSIDLNGINNKGCIADVILLRKNFNEHKRSVTTGDYGTICLPYEVDMTSLSGVEKVYKVSSMTSDLATLTPVEAMEAGKPYIFKSNVDADEVVMPAKVGGTVVGTPQKDTYLVGTFADIDKMDYGTYVLSGNKFCKVVEGNEDDAVTLAAYRCYFKPLTNGVKNFGFVEDDGETTGIDKIESEVDIKNAVIYDLTGRIVTSPVKGIYIVNGKKMVIDNLK